MRSFANAQDDEKLFFNKKHRHSEGVNKPNEVSFNFLSCLVVNLHVQAKNLVEYRLKSGEILRFVSLLQNDIVF